MRKRWFIGAACAAALLGAAYTGYWFWLAQAVEQNLVLWVNQQRALGFRISYVAGELSGYPLAIRIPLSQVEIAAPDGRAPWQIRTAAMSLRVAPWSPLALRLVDGEARAACRLQWVAAGRAFGATIDGLDLRIGLSTDGEPPAIRVAGASAAVIEQGRQIIGLTQPSGSVEFLQAASDTQSSVAFMLSARDIEFVAPALTDVKAVATRDWLVAGQVKGPVPQASLPVALAAWSNQGGHVELTQFNATWEAATTVSGDGTVALDQRLQPVGAFSAVVRGYDEAVDAVVARGLMTPAQATAAKIWLNARAEKDERGTLVKLPLTIQDGFLSIGPIKLAQVPPIAWE